MEKYSGYFNNAATSYPKPDCVYDFADSVYRKCGGNIGRGASPIAKSAGVIAKETKELLKELFHCKGKQVVFTPSATDALNKILLGLEFKTDDYIYCTPFEHNAVTRPLYHLEQNLGVHIEELSFERTSLQPNVEEIEEQFKSRPPKCVVTTHVSNVCGVIVPFIKIAELAKLYDSTVILDMSQSAGIIDVNLSSTLIDFAVFAGHKSLMGPFGIGGFICNADATLNPIMFGGNGINSIEQDMPKDIVKMTEIGSQNLYSIAGLHAAVEWILSEKVEQLRLKESKNRDVLLSLLAQYDNIRLIGINNQASYGGVVSTVFDGYSPDEIELILGNFGISVRSGLHCAPYAHRFLGTLPSGTVRFSVSALTASDDFQILKNALYELQEDW